MIYGKKIGWLVYFITIYSLYLLKRGTTVQRRRQENAQDFFGRGQLNYL